MGQRKEKQTTKLYIGHPVSSADRWINKKAENVINSTYKIKDEFI